MPFIRRNAAGRFFAPYIEGFIVPQQDVGEAVQYLGSTGVDVQKVHRRAPPSDLTVHAFLRNVPDAKAARDYLTELAWQFGTIEDESGSQWTVLFHGPIVPRILRGSYTYDGSTYNYRIICPLRVEAQSGEA